MSTIPSEIEIFRAGRHVAMSGETLSFGADELAATAATYDPAMHEAPICVGHPRHDDPAYGWVRSLRVVDGRLVAGVADVDPGFAELFRAGRFRKVSAAFYRPDATDNPRPGAWTLRHVGFLGAAPPAVKGLKPAQFTDPEFADAHPGVLAFETEEEPLPDQSDAFDVPAAQDVPDAAELARRARDLAARETAFAERERLARRQADAALVAALVADGRILAAEQDGFVRFLGQLAADHAAFGEPGGEPASQPGAGATARDFFLTFLTRLPRRVEFGELAGGGPGLDPGAFAAPPGFGVDPDAAALHGRALAYQRNHPDTDYVAAVRAVGGR